MGEPISDSHERYVDKMLKSCATFLSRWKAAQAERSELSWPPNGLRILLTADGVSGNLVIVCFDPLLLSGPSMWTNADIAVVRDRLPEDLREEYQLPDGFRVIDQAAGLDLITPRLEVFENLKLKSPSAGIRRPPAAFVDDQPRP